MKLRITSNQTGQLLNLSISYEDRNGRNDNSISTIYMESQQPEYFDNSGIRKGILLTRYASLLKNWAADERQHYQYAGNWNLNINESTGISISVDSSKWERTSQSLTCSPTYMNYIRVYRDYFIKEMQAIEDSSLSQERMIMDTLLNK